MKHTTIKTFVAAGIGAALWVVIGVLINIPTPVPNTSIQLQYALQSLLALLFGPLAGFLVGFLGHAVKDAIAPYGLWWSWIIASGIFGLLVGLAKHRFALEKGIFTTKQVIAFNLIQLLANLAVWGVLAPSLDVLIYSEPIQKVFVQGLVAGLVNALAVGVGGTILLSVYSKSRVQSGSLSKD